MSSRTKTTNRRMFFLKLSGLIESQLRDAYAKKNELGLETQTSLAEKLGVHRSTVNKRLSGARNLTLESIADLIWALGQDVKVEIFDPHEKPTNGKTLISEYAHNEVAPRDIQTGSASRLKVSSEMPSRLEATSTTKIQNVHKYDAVAH